MKNYGQKDTAAPYERRLLPCSRGEPTVALQFQIPTFKSSKDITIAAASAKAAVPESQWFSFS